MQGRIQDFKLGCGAHIKKLRRAEGGAKFVGVFRVKNHDFTPKYFIFSNFRGGARRVRLPLDPHLVWGRYCACQILIANPIDWLYAGCLEYVIFVSIDSSEARKQYDELSVNHANNNLCT
jgi:hypothetical protein